MSRHEESTVENKKKDSSIEFKDDDVVISERTEAFKLPIMDMGEKENKSSGKHAMKQGAYVTEIMQFTQKEVGLAKKVRVGIEKIFEVIKCALFAAVFWISQKINPTNEEKV